MAHPNRPRPPLHHVLAIGRLGQVAVVRAAEQADILRTAVATERAGFVVVELQTASRTAPPTGGIDKRTLVTVALDNDAFDGSRNVARSG